MHHVRISGRSLINKRSKTNELALWKRKSRFNGVEKIVVAIETSAIRLGLVNPDIYRDMHVLYHAIIEALHGVTRGQVELGGLLRTAGLRFAIVRGRPFKNGDEGMDCCRRVWNDWSTSSGI